MLLGYENQRLKLAQHHIRLEPEYSPPSDIIIFNKGIAIDTPSLNVCSSLICDLSTTKASRIWPRSMFTYFGILTIWLLIVRFWYNQTNKLTNQHTIRRMTSKVITEVYGKRLLSNALSEHVGVIRCVKVDASTDWDSLIASHEWLQTEVSYIFPPVFFIFNLKSILSPVFFTTNLYDGTGLDSISPVLLTFFVFFVIGL